MSYGDRFGSRIQTPPCHGEPAAFEPDSPECTECRLRNSCRVIVEKKIANTQTRVADYPARWSGNGNGNGNAPVVVPDRLREDHADDEGFFNVLFHNSGLSAVSAVFREFVFGVDAIPRRKYPNPFSRPKKDQ